MLVGQCCLIPSLRSIPSPKSTLNWPTNPFYTCSLCVQVLFKKKEVPNKCIFLLVAQCGGKTNS